MSQDLPPSPTPKKKQDDRQPEPAPPQTEASLGQVFEGLLKSPESLMAGIFHQAQARIFLPRLLVLALLGCLVFGVTLGAFSYHEQLWAAPLKTVTGLAFSALICLPSLYIFAALTGSSLHLREIVQGLAGALALLGILLLGFTPVLWVFSQSTESEAFFGTLVLAVWLIALFFGSGFLVKMLGHGGSDRRGPLRIWLGIFFLVTLQMSTSLRPLIGRSEVFFTTEKRFFLEHWVDQMSGSSAKDRQPRSGQIQEPPRPQGSGR